MTDARQREASVVPRHAQPLPSPLAGTRLLSSRFLSPEDRQAIEDSVGPIRSFNTAVDLIREGECADTLHIITKGWACRYTTTRDGGRQLPAVMVPGDICNLDSLLMEQLDFGVRTLSEVVVVPLARDRASALASQHPGIARTFLWLALIENATLGKWALSLGRRSSRERLAHLLCELSVRLGIQTDETSSFAFPLTQEILADALGLTSVHVNRTMQRLRADGLVVTGAKTITLPDIAGLRRIAGFDPRYLRLEPRMV